MIKYMPNNALFLLHNELSIMTGFAPRGGDDVYFFDVNDDTVYCRYELIEYLQGEISYSLVEKEYNVKYIEENSYVHIFSKDTDCLD